MCVGCRNITWQPCLHAAEACCVSASHLVATPVRCARTPSRRSASCRWPRYGTYLGCHNNIRQPCLRVEEACCATLLHLVEIPMRCGAQEHGQRWASYMGVANVCWSPHWRCCGASSKECPPSTACSSVTWLSNSSCFMHRDEYPQWPACLKSSSHACAGAAACH